MNMKYKRADEVLPCCSHTANEHSEVDPLAHDCDACADERDSMLAETTEEQRQEANDAALVMAGIASERACTCQSPTGRNPCKGHSCGLGRVLDALAIREMVREHRDGR